MRRVSLILVLILIPAVASADRHKAGAGGGGRWADGSNLWGFHITGDRTLHGARLSSDPMGKGIFSLVAEGNGVFGDSRDQFTALGGLRYTFNDFPADNVELFVQGLVGGYFGDGSSSLAGSVGVGTDIMFADDGHGWGLRLQYDPGWIHDRSNEWYNQAAVALIYRFCD